MNVHSLSDGRWGLRLLLRKDDDRYVGAVTRIWRGFDCALLAEAMSLHEALDLIQHWNLQKTIIEMDAKVIVHAVHNHTKPKNIYLG
jgi:ribonuclease HI